MTGISDKERQTLLSMVEDVAGPDVREVAIILLTHKGELTDEVISDELGIKLNQVRKQWAGFRVEWSLVHER